LGNHFRQAQGDVELIHKSTEGIIRHGEKIRSVDLGEGKLDLPKPAGQGSSQPPDA